MFLRYPKGVVDEKDADEVEDGDDPDEVVEVVGVEEELYEFLVVAWNHDVVDALHHLERVAVVDCFLPCLQVAQTLLQLYRQLMLRRLLLLLIFIAEKTTLRLLRLTV